MRQIKWGAVLMGALLVGCSNPGPGSNGRTTAAGLKEGLNILYADPAWGLNAAYLQSGRVVYFESRIGALKPEIYRTEFPDEPAYEIDARYIDANGSTFKTQIGGDQYIDPTWAADIRAHSAHPADRDLDFKLSRDLGTALTKVATAMPEMKDHLFHAANLGAHVPSEMPTLTARAQQIKASLPAEAQYNASCYYNWLEIDLYGKCIFACIGHHSSTIGWNYSNCTSSWDEEIVACNHGSCGGDSSLSYQCYSNPSAGWLGNYKDLNAALSQETSGGKSTSYGACASGYNWNPHSYDGHECNDDSSFEMWQVKDSGSYGYRNSSLGDSWSFCWNGDGNGNHFSCNATCGSYSGHWSIPTCP